jgi:leucine-rich repeat protein SHOC2
MDDRSLVKQLAKKHRIVPYATFNEDSYCLSLDFSNLSLSTFPDEICEMRKLRHLSLYRTSVASLPSIIGQLTDLHTLVLCDTILNELPLEIGALKHLEMLDISRTLVSYLPATIGQLTQLCYFFGEGIPITQLPIEVGELHNLVVLNLNDTKIQKIPVSLSQFPHLQKLFLNNTLLAHLSFK